MGEHSYKLEQTLQMIVDIPDAFGYYGDEDNFMIISEESNYDSETTTHHEDTYYSQPHDYSDYFYDISSPKQRSFPFIEESRMFPEDKLMSRKRTWSNTLDFNEPATGLFNESKKLKTRTETKTSSNRQLTSQFKGVCWYKRTQKWVVQIKVKGVRKHVGYFNDEHVAGEAYLMAVAKVESGDIY